MSMSEGDGERTGGNTLRATRPVAIDRFGEPAHDGAGRSNFVAFLLGGFIIAGGLLAFMYYDAGNASRSDALTTGSIAREAPAAVPSITVPPSRPAD